MKCHSCKQKAIIRLKYADRALCADCFTRFYERRVQRCLTRSKALKRPGKTAVGVSGGKDSMSLLHFLCTNGYNPTAITIDEGIKGYRNKTLATVTAYCKKHGVMHRVFSFKKAFGVTLDELAKRGQPCSSCGVLRRRLLNNAARELGCNKLATGHNLDDEAQTALMNFLRNELKRSSRSANGSTKLVPRVKPLSETPERENVAYALVNKVPFCDAECPYASTAYRNAVRCFLNEMESVHPGTKQAVMHAGDNLTARLNNKGAPRACAACGEPSAAATCKTCSLLSR